MMDLEYVIDSSSRYTSLGEVWQYRDLLYFLTMRNIRARYAQSVLGVGWAVVNPLVQMVIFTVIFGGFVKVNSDGAPYAIFSYTALVPWTFFASAVAGAGNSLVNNQMINKVYFPRIILPLSSVLDKLVDFLIAMGITLVLIVIYPVRPTAGVVVLPLLVLIMVLTAMDLGTLLTSMAIQYRDIAYGMRLLITVLMYATPVVYPLSAVPESFRLLYALNPMVGVIAGFRSALLGTIDMPWDVIAVSGLAACVWALLSFRYFQRRERLFADIA